MTKSLSAQRKLDDETLWRAMRQLLERLFGVIDAESGMDQGLEILLDVLGADRGMILLVHGDGSTQVLRARDREGDLDTLEREEISRTLVRRALDTGKCIAWDPMSDLGASESVTSLGIIAALVAPLFAGAQKRETRGVLYVDFRDARKFVGDRHIEFFESAAPLLGAVLEQSRRLRLAREQLTEARAHCMEVSHAPPLDDLLSSPSLAEIRRDVTAALGGTSSILVLGESGTGKTLLAQAIAEASPRRPVVRAVLGSSDDLNTITSELFGHERGSFSGAATRRVGLVEFAKGGTLILDEVLNLAPNAQKLLLDFTQFGSYRPLGWDKAEPKRADVRIVAATNGDLEAAIAEGRFRADLYHRLAAVVVHMPPLRDRRQDIPYLAEAYLRRGDPSRKWQLSLALRRVLVSDAFDWPGNVRQLERVIQRARDRAVAEDPKALALEPSHLDMRAIEKGPTAPPSKEEKYVVRPDKLAEGWRRLQDDRAATELYEAETIKAALTKTGGVVAAAARELGIARTTLSSRIDALGLTRR